MQEIELKPCPFCGGGAVVHVNDGVRVICIQCGATTKCLVDSYSQGKPCGSAIKSVVKAWNERKPVERIVERLEEFQIDNQHEENAGFIDMCIDIVKKEWLTQ